jgi:SAM-dependent methyltransferase
MPGAGILKQAFRAAYEREQFLPGRLGLLLNPFYFARRGLYENLVACRPYLHGSMLDVGCGQKPYRSIFDVSRYVGMEVDRPEARAAGVADVYYDGTVFPFEDASFDCVLTNQVLEHVFTPAQFVREIRRVLKLGGTLVITVPFVWDEHCQPWDYARYSSFGLRHLLEEAGMKILESRKSMSDVRVLFQLANAYLFKINPFTSGRTRLAFSLASTAPLNIVGELASRVLPGNEDLYLDNVVVAEKADHP